MKPHYFLIFLLLLPIAQAGVSRDFTYNGSIYFTSFSIPAGSQDKYIKVTLTPLPFDSYDDPGYYVTEYIPPGLSVYNVSADWYDLTGSTLTLLKFNPTISTSTLSYTLKFKDTGKYTIYGTYKDENKVAGEIIQQTISIEAPPIIDFKGSWNPLRPKPVDTEITSTELTANQVITTKPIIEEDKYTLFSDRLLILVVLLIIILSLLAYRKYRSKPKPESKLFNKVSPMVYGEYNSKPKPAQDEQEFIIIDDNVDDI